jgi:hypothetical protein
MHSGGMCFGPVNAAASAALGKSIMTGEDVRRYSQRHQFTRNPGQRGVASGASRERNRARIEIEAPNSLAKLIPDRVALDDKHVGRGAKALVASQQDSVAGACNPEKLGAIQRRIRDDVGSEQSQPSSQSHEHPVNGEAGSFIHRDGLYYITDRRKCSYEKYKATV